MFAKIEKLYVDGTVKLFSSHFLAGLTVQADGSTIASAGADSRIVLWKDRTDETRLAEIEADQEKTEQAQHLANLIEANQLVKALKYAILLDHPSKTLKIIEGRSCGRSAPRNVRT